MKMEFVWMPIVGVGCLLGTYIIILLIIVTINRLEKALYKRKYSDETVVNRFSESWDK